MRAATGANERVKISPETHALDYKVVGRVALLERKKRKEAERISRSVEYVELTLMEDFQQNLIEAIHIPHMTDAFPATLR